MNIYFTADCHFGHDEIIKFCNRPFKNVEYMNEEIVARWCRKIKPNDLVYHLGDFAFKGGDSAQYWQSKLTGNIVHILGNHDKNNGVKSILRYSIMVYGGLVIYAKHKPPVEGQKGTIERNLIDISDIILCGHVHNLWKWKWIYNKICINVGQDVWGFEPVSIHSILKLISKIRRGLV